MEHRSVDPPMLSIAQICNAVARTPSTPPLLVSPTDSNATESLSRSFPTTLPLAAELRTTIDLSREFEHRTSAKDGGLGIEDTQAGAPRQKKMEPSRSLWYAAFILVLERGRPAAATRMSFSEIQNLDVN